MLWFREMRPRGGRIISLYAIENMQIAFITSITRHVPYNNRLLSMLVNRNARLSKPQSLLFGVGGVVFFYKKEGQGAKRRVLKRRKDS